LPAPAAIIMPSTRHLVAWCKCSEPQPDPLCRRVQVPAKFNHGVIGACCTCSGTQPRRDWRMLHVQRTSTTAWLAYVARAANLNNGVVGVCYACSGAQPRRG
jgi:hypothetical protein